MSFAVKRPKAKINLAVVHYFALTEKANA